MPTSWSKSISASLVILKTCASNLLNLKCENMIGKLYLTMSSNKIIDFVPAADGKITIDYSIYKDEVSGFADSLVEGD
jgi:hypothetical protein